MNKKSKLALAGTVFAASAIAIACTVVQEPLFDINIGGVSSPDDVGKVVQEALGGVYGPDVDVNGIVRYSVGRGGFGLGMNVIPFWKPCGKTFEQAWEDIQNRPPPSEGGSGSGSGGWVYFPGFPGMPGDCWGDCGGTVEVGDLEQA